jgi:5-methylcytosine-specific restriction protein B
MTLDDLASALVKMYNNADSDKVAMIHLFGIRYAKEIQLSGFNANEIIKRAKLPDGSYMPESYKTEISKGINLSKYVIDKIKLKELING